MATCTTPKWSDSYTPVVQLEVTQSSSTTTTATLQWTLRYIASYAVSSSASKAYTVKIGGSKVSSSTYNINGVTGTKVIASGTHTINKTTAAQSIAFSVDFAFNLTWTGVYGGTKSASGTISVAAKTKYTISYNANGGSGAPSSQSKWAGTAITLSKTVPTRSGYTFKGWSTSSSATTASVQPGATYNTDSSVTYYAVWETTYTPGRITNLTAYRSSTTPTSIIVKFDWATDVAVQTMAVYYLKSGVDYTNTTPPKVTVTPSGTTSYTGQTVTITGCTTESSYTIYVQVWDGIKTARSISKTVGTTVYTIDGYKGGNGVAFGKAAERAGYAEFAFNALFGKSAYFTANNYFRGTNSTSVVNSTNKLIFVLDDYTVKQAIMSGGTGLWISDNINNVANGCGMDFSYMMWKPLTNDKLYLGGANFKWKSVYAVTGSIQTSDRNKKDDIKPISDKYEMLFSKLKPVTYKLKSSEGETHDRVHTGYISQDIEESLEECGLTGLEFAAFCKDIKQTIKEDSDEVIDILDEDGNPTYEYSLRYEEFIALNTHMIQQQQKRIDDLENEVSELKEMVKTLMKEV